MRISVDPSDPGYSNWSPSMAGTVHVFLDGTEIKKVITADEEEGIVILVKHDDRNPYFLNEEKNDLVRETLRGKVKIMVDN